MVLESICSQRHTYILLLEMFALNLSLHCVMMKVTGGSRWNISVVIWKHVLLTQLTSGLLLPSHDLERSESFHIVFIYLSTCTLFPD